MLVTFGVNFSIFRIKHLCSPSFAFSSLTGLVSWILQCFYLLLVFKTVKKKKNCIDSCCGSKVPWACSSDPLEGKGEGNPPSHILWLGTLCLARETFVVWFTRSPKELLLLQNEQENFGFARLYPDFDVPPLDGSNDSVSLSVKWETRIVFPL